MRYRALPAMPRVNTPRAGPTIGTLTENPENHPYPGKNRAADDLNDAAPSSRFKQFIYDHLPLPCQPASPQGEQPYFNVVFLAIYRQLARFAQQNQKTIKFQLVIDEYLKPRCETVIAAQNPCGMKKMFLLLHDVHGVHQTGTLANGIPVFRPAVPTAGFVVA